MSELLMLTPWRHEGRSPAGRLGSLYGVSTSKVFHWATFLKNILGQAPLCQPCFSRLVRDTGATLEGTVCSLLRREHDLVLVLGTVVRLNIDQDLLLRRRHQ